MGRCEVVEEKEVGNNEPRTGIDRYPLIGCCLRCCCISQVWRRDWKLRKTSSDGQSLSHSLSPWCIQKSRRMLKSGKWLDVVGVIWVLIRRLPLVLRALKLGLYFPEVLLRLVGYFVVCQDGLWWWSRTDVLPFTNLAYLNDHTHLSFFGGWGVWTFVRFECIYVLPFFCFCVWSCWRSTCKQMYAPIKFRSPLLHYYILFARQTREITRLFAIIFFLHICGFRVVFLSSRPPPELNILFRGYKIGRWDTCACLGCHFYWPQWIVLHAPLAFSSS